MNARVVLAIDPGTSKCGLALVERDEDHKISLLWSCVASVEAILEKMDEALRIRSYHFVILGGGTGSSALISRLREKYPSLSILTVDERDTSYQARERYWERNPRRGWRRLLPATLQTPPVPVDDFVALILAERVLASP